MLQRESSFSGCVYYNSCKLCCCCCTHISFSSSSSKSFPVISSFLRSAPLPNLLLFFVFSHVLNSTLFQSDSTFVLSSWNYSPKIYFLSSSTSTPLHPLSSWSDSPPFSLTLLREVLFSSSCTSPAFSSSLSALKSLHSFYVHQLFKND